MQPPAPLLRELEAYDRGLRCRWSDAVGRFCIERKHGYAGLGTDAVLQMLHSKWRKLEDDAQAPSEDKRAAWDEFDSRRQGYQPIFYVQQSEIYRIPDIICILVGMDIRRAGGPHAWAQAHKDAQESVTRMVRAQRKERLRALAEEAYDRVAIKKDYHGSGGDPWFYKHDKLEPKE